MLRPLYYSIGPSLRGIAPLRAQAGQTAGCWRSRASFSPATWRVGGLSRTLKGVYMGSIRVPLKGSIRGLGGSGLVSRVISTLKSILIGVVVLVTPSIGFRLSQA